jgi:GMC oxidoreductase
MEHRRSVPRKSLLRMIGYVQLVENISYWGIRLSSHTPSGPFQIREHVAPEPTSEPPGSASETNVNELLRIYQNRSDFIVGNVKHAQPFLPTNDSNVVWRAHSIFHPITGARRSSDTILDRDNKNLNIRTNALVSKVLFDGDAGIPAASRVRATETPRARCVRLETDEVICIKAQGRIYISAGAFHTPELLLKSGIGPHDGKVVNAKVRGSMQTSGRNFELDAQHVKLHYRSAQISSTNQYIWLEEVFHMNFQLPMSSISLILLQSNKGQMACSCTKKYTLELMRCSPSWDGNATLFPLLFETRCLRLRHRRFYHFVRGTFKTR